MCGVAGILTTSDSVPMSAALVAMREAPRHRGPDDEGLELVDISGGFRNQTVNSRLAAHVIETKS